MEDYIAGKCLPVAVPEGVWDLVATIRRKAAAEGAHRAFSVADLVIAATAIRLQLTVLHEDRDFVTAARFMPQLRERKLSAGPQAK
jgi:predicted nucleic acid-binding protein